MYVSYMVAFILSQSFLVLTNTIISSFLESEDGCV